MATVSVGDRTGGQSPEHVYAPRQLGSPAAAAKIEVGDLITTINGSALMKAQDFAPTIATFSPGTVVSLSTNRNGEPKEVQLVVGSGKCPAVAKRAKVRCPVMADTVAKVAAKEL